jgi:hypothetical protein
MTYIAVRCPRCQSEQIIKRGKTAQGAQRYLCQNTLCAVRSFLLHLDGRCTSGHLHFCNTAPTDTKVSPIPSSNRFASTRLV